jgi:hypothetical protein
LASSSVASIGRRQRWQAEKDAGTEPAQYPPIEDLRLEQRELDPAVVLIVSDEEGNVIRRVTGPVKAGFQRVAWDLRYPPPNPILSKPPEPNVFSPPPSGPLVVPGKYSVRLAKRIDGVETPVGTAQTFNVVPLYLSIMNETDRQAVLAFQRQASRLQKSIFGAAQATEDALERVKLVRQALNEIEGPDAQLVARVNAIDKTLRDIDEELNGDAVLRSLNEPAPPSLVDRITVAVNGLTTTAPPTNTHREALTLAEQQLTPLLAKLRKAIEVDLAEVEKQMNALGAPWTPGRVPG